MEFKLDANEARYIAIKMYVDEKEQASQAERAYDLAVAEGGKELQDECWSRYKLHKARAERWWTIYKQADGLTITSK